MAGRLAASLTRQFAEQPSKWVQIASQFQPQMKQTIAFPLPQKGETIFYLLTDGGVFFASALEEQLGEDRHSLSRLFHAGHAVISEFRLIDERREKKP